MRGRVKVDVLVDGFVLRKGLGGFEKNCSFRFFWFLVKEVFVLGILELKGLL